MKTIRELCLVWDSNSLQLAKCLEAREKERDARRDEERIALEKRVKKLQNLQPIVAKFLAEYWVWQGDGDDLESLTCPIVIHPDDMRKRDAAERERVKAAVSSMSFTEGHRKSILDTIYPPPKPVKLKAGWYWWRISPEYSWVCSFQREDFKPLLREYRPWNDPPPEVTGKVEPQLPTCTGCGLSVSECSGCGLDEPQLPTFEEWCKASGRVE